MKRLLNAFGSRKYMGIIRNENSFTHLIQNKFEKFWIFTNIDGAFVVVYFSSHLSFYSISYSCQIKIDNNVHVFISSNVVFFITRRQLQRVSQ